MLSWWTLCITLTKWYQVADNNWAQGRKMMWRGKNVKSSVGEKAQNEVAKWEYINFCDPNIAAAQLSEFFTFSQMFGNVFLLQISIFYNFSKVGKCLPPSYFYFFSFSQMFGHVFLLLFIFFTFSQMFGNVFLLHIVQPVLEINDMEGLFCQLQIF